MFHIFSKFKGKLLWIFTILLLLLLLFCTYSVGMRYYEKTDFVTGLVTATTLNVRSGPGTTYNVVNQVYKNEYIRVFAKVGNWYVIQTDSDYIGAVSTDYVKPIYPNQASTTNQNTSTNNTAKTTGTVGLTKDEKETLDLINKQRTAAGLQVLIVDDEVQNVARVKAKDMVESGYFSHTSPTYGSPFDMLKNYGITYKTAGENIAGNSTNSGAVNAWMNSSRPQGKHIKHQLQLHRPSSSK